MVLFIYHSISLGAQQVLWICCHNVFQEHSKLLDAFAAVSENRLMEHGAAEDHVYLISSRTLGGAGITPNGHP